MSIHVLPTFGGALRQGEADGQDVGDHELDRLRSCMASSATAEMA